MGKVFWKPGNLLYPLPAVMISSGREGEKPNIFTAAWAGTTCSTPAMVSVSIRPERYSYEIIKDTGEFVINLTTEKLVRATDYCGCVSGRDVDKFQAAGLTPQPSKAVKCPGIAESPVNLECRVVSVTKLGSHDMFLAEVVGMDVDDAWLDAKGRFDLNAAKPIAYSHGEYFTLGKKIGSFGFSVRKKK